MITDRTDNYSATAKSNKGQVMLVNLFTPKEHMVEQFIAAQTGEYVRLKGLVKGWIGNKLGRAVDGNQLVNVAIFDNIENYNEWRQSQLFAEHLDVIKPFVANASPGMYQVIYSASDLS
jgi:heme-degrading monooxygenase HmoA